ncbi:aromatic amino acid DMT transporter YddG [Wohlfahrtiimonas chitiniclastica]|uniref:Aromatic amino acid DMT transporter YddG n=1 Tax=Wohlfahrtiimonas chitiniclastica TaxID=400946 RepID=A0AB35BXD2_9GAMM|nr:aromatic amino acid DMT transporter YddG [Wohlfahrtiimonas chitiniclastica]MBS7823748.1 aromatic amino acid DMT transporter YddG [Wohlfahrtiimonas chitiniclastica]MBS7839366.1 aromatic amino acid DMT transporter YddG [Wohlfahrtiimonas chitiniclastica]
MNRQTATWIGLSAIVLWSANVGLLRQVAVHFGAVGGAALTYSVATVFLLITLARPSIKAFSKTYLIWGSLLFVAYEVCFSLAIGYANTAEQAIEVGMVNYLWPTFTIVAAILFNHQKSNLWIIPGFIVSCAGIVWILGGEAGISVSMMLNNISDNPLSYGLAFVGAVIWAAYCIVTARLAKGQNGITLFFLLVAITLWLQYGLTGQSNIEFSWVGTGYLLMAGAAMGFGYAAWNVGILHGNVTLLATASYFVPVLSAVLAAILLSAPLSFSFWMGVVLVCLGSIICLWSTRHA